MDKKFTCPCCNTMIMVNVDALEAMGGKVICPECQMILQADGDYLYVPVEGEPVPPPFPGTTTEEEAETAEVVDDVEEVEVENVDSDLDLYDAAIEYLKTCNAITVPMLQRYFEISEQEATLLMDDLEKNGVVAPFTGGPRKILIEHNEGLPGAMSRNRTYATDRIIKQLQEQMAQGDAPKLRSCSCSLPMILFIVLLTFLLMHFFAR